MNLKQLATRPAPLALDRPLLNVVVDTEEEFDWSKPFDREATGTRSAPAQARAHELFARYGVVPTYVMNHPVARCPAAARFFRGLLEQGVARIGAHCHPWVTPPFDEEVNAFNSFHGNLPEALEEAKITATTRALEDAFGCSPKVFKAGRYGVGPRTFDIIRRLGYEVDCSFMPATSFEHEQGPDFRGTPDRPFFVGEGTGLLEVPATAGYSGALAFAAPRLAGWLESGPMARARVPGLLNRLGLLQRRRLSPEGFDAQAQIGLIEAMRAQGVQVFTLTYHSPSLEPGHTPYVRDGADLAEFLRRIEAVLRYFQTEVQGRFSTIEEVRALALQGQHASAAQRGTMAQVGS